MPHMSSEDGRNLVGLSYPGIQCHRRPSTMTGAPTPSMPAPSHSRGLLLRLLGTRRPTLAGKARGAGNPFSGLQDRQRVACQQCYVEERGEESRAGEAVAQQATSWAELLRHVTVVRRILGTWPPAATGDLVCTSQPLLHHHKPRNGQLAQTAKTQMSFCWHLSKSWGSVGCKEARAT